MLPLQNDPRLDSLDKIDFSMLSQWKPADLTDNLRLMTAVENYLMEFGSPESNLFNQSALLVLSPSQEQDIKKRLLKAKNELEKLIEQANELAIGMKLPKAQCFTDIKVLHHAGNYSLSAPNLKGVQLNPQDWQTHRDDINTLIESGKAMEELSGQLQKKIH